MKKHILIFTFLLIAFTLRAQDVDIFTIDGLAIRGYDPVAYFTENKPVKGSDKFVFTWQGVEWRFKDEKNMLVFKANPEQFAPQYGGYCAYGLSEDHKSPTEPDAFTIVDNRLYLNYNLKVKELWSKDIPGRLVKADKHWTRLKNKENK